MNKVLLQEKTKNEQKQTLQDVLLQEKQANCKNFASRKNFKNGQKAKVKFSVSIFGRKHSFMKPNIP